MAYRISELPAGTPPYLGSALLELSVVNGAAPSGYDTRKALLADITAAVGDGIVTLDDVTIQDSTLTGATDVVAYRIGASYNNAAISFAAPRSGTADGATSTGRGYLLVPGDSATTAASLFIGAANGAAAVAGDPAAIRANLSSVEVLSGGLVDFWRSGVRYARLTSGAGTLRSYVATGTETPQSSYFGIATTIPDGNLAVGKTAATAYTNNMEISLTDYERALLGDWTVSGVARYGTVHAGTGAARDVSLVRGGVELMRLGSTGLETAARLWVSRTNPVDDTFTSVCYGNGLFVAVATTGSVGGRVMSSPDGINWTARTAATAWNWTGVTYGAGLFVAVSSSGAATRVMTSPDAITWTARASASETTNWQGVTYGKGLFVAVASVGTGADLVQTSPDGITWTIRTGAAALQWRAVCYGNGLFVATSQSGTGNRVMTSPDGITWTSRTSAADSAWFGVTYGNGLYVAVANSGAATRVMTSPDGINWTARTITLNQWAAVTYGAGAFVAVANVGTNRIATSPDGITWTARASPADTNAWLGVTYGNGLFVGVANTGTGNRVMTSGAQLVANVGLGG
ncbi:MAG TPA: hypothetical protein VEW06_06430 [Xanthobacteraceae bacterium]|nr:hypothetical protein [Xanthobacteraceae bacterium]